MDYHNGKAVNSYFRCAQFESQQGYQLSFRILSSQRSCYKEFYLLELNAMQSVENQPFSGLHGTLNSLHSIISLKLELTSYPD